MVNSKFVLPGDIVLIRTGQVQVYFGGDAHGYHNEAPGLNDNAAEWFRDRDIAAAAMDTIAFELFPSTIPEIGLPLHLLSLVMLGLL